MRKVECKLIFNVTYSADGNKRPAIHGYGLMNVVKEPSKKTNLRTSIQQ